MSISPQEYRDVLSHWTSGVTIVTSVAEGRPIGITASSFTSVSLQPPQILILVNRRLATHTAILDSRVFAVNLLTAEQVEWGMRFAGMLPEQGERFADIDWTTAVTGCAILPNVLGWLDCRVGQIYAAEEHSIFIGEVLDAGFREDADPLVYYHRQWRRLDGEQLLR